MCGCVDLYFAYHLRQQVGHKNGNIKDMMIKGEVAEGESDGEGRSKLALIDMQTPAADAFA